jgi:hypothetical protein
MDHAGFFERARRRPTSSEILEPAPWLLALTHLLEQPDRLDPLARVDVYVPSESFEDR